MAQETCRRDCVNLAVFAVKVPLFVKKKKTLCIFVSVSNWMYPHLGKTNLRKLPLCPGLRSVL
jgi:hypothetical protein